MGEFGLVAVGGALGAMARHGLSGLVQRQTGSGFPLGTLTVNVLGCLCIGILMTLVSDRQAFSPATRQVIGIGFLGALTTFSTFGHETMALTRGGETSWALLNVVANLSLGLLAVALGRRLVWFFSG